MSSANEALGPIGIVATGSRPYSFSFISRRPVPVGVYVVVDGSEGSILGLVEDSQIESRLMDNARSFDAGIDASRAAAKDERDKRNSAFVQVAGLLEHLKKGSQFMPSLPAVPGSAVHLAPAEALSAVFSRDSGEWLKIGKLLRDDGVDVSVNVNRVASRHLAILATTGSGKSNLLALIAKGIADMYGTMLILDYQGEYSELRIKNVVNLQAKVNPRLLDAERLADMLDVRQGAEIQRTVLNQAMTQQVKDAEDFWGSLVASLNNIRDSEGSSAGTRNAAVRLVEIIERARRRKGRVLDPTIGNPIDMVAPNHINVLGMQDLSEMQAAFVISYYLEEVFERRKEARYARSAGGEGADRIKFRSPVVIAIEEAHTFLPGGEEKTDASRMAFKIAREGRKFGVGLIVISQRPSRVDQDVLSQMGSLAVSRITQPKDQNYILESSELVTEKLVSYLPSLNVGETVLLGQWVTLPSVVRVRKVDEKLVGADINAEREWREDLEMQGIARESTDDLIRRPD